MDKIQITDSIRQAKAISKTLQSGLNMEGDYSQKSPIDILIELAERVIAEPEVKPIESFSEGIDLITKEREEQILKHGFTRAHDNEHVDEELLKAAIFILTENWDWFPAKTWKIEWGARFLDKGKLEKLAVAGALVAAEIDRLIEISIANNTLSQGE